MTEDPTVDRIGTLAAIGRGLEREGAYNGAKLVRALLDRELTRLADRESPIGSDAIAAAVESVRDDVSAESGAEIADILTQVARAVRDGATITLADVPHVRTCRVCGELFVGDRIAPTCPTCEAPAFSFREHLPVWYLEPAEPGTILAALAAGPEHVTAAVRGRDDEALDTPPADGEWSARQTLEHLVYAEHLLATRVPRLLEEDEPDLVAWVVGTGAPVSSDEGSADTGSRASILVARHRDLRERTLARLGPLDATGWARAGRHPEWGRVTVLSQAAYFARHEAAHLAQLRAAADGRLPGARSAAA
ncbi:MAG: DinB family protein [Chloroflexota bacterium]